MFESAIMNTVKELKKMNKGLNERLDAIIERLDVLIEIEQRRDLPINTDHWSNHRDPGS